MKTELETLRAQKAKYEGIIEEKDIEISELEDRIWELENDQSQDETKGILDTETLEKSMMFDKLSRNWHLITQSDIDAICKF